MKFVCGLPFLFFFFSAIGQKQDLPHTYIDHVVRKYEASAAALLAKELTHTAQTDREKVVALFRWITDNISYNTRAHGRRGSMMPYDEPGDDDTTILKPLNLRIAETVLRRRIGVCDGYARLFKTLCDFAGVPAEAVTGYGRSNWGRRTPFGSNHTWNAVYVDSAWHLLDATWASGYTNYRGDEFFRRYDERYFFTPPAQFIVDHYPDDIRWTLLKEPPAQSEFNQAPFRYLGFIKTGVQAFKPAKGIIEASVGDSVQFEVDALTMQGLLEVVSGEQPRDSIPNDDVPVVIGGRKKKFTYKITEQTGDWLYVICNGYVVLRYKLNIRKPENKVASVSGQ